MSDDESSDDNYIPPEILEAACAATESGLPEKSKDIYTKCYTDFIDWQKSKKNKSFEEPVLLAYFHQECQNLNSATLWSRYSMLKRMLMIKNNVDITTYAKLRSYLKNKHIGYKPKKSKVLSTENIKKFLDEAPDNVYLGTKVRILHVLINGYLKN